jgi:hypothetical protein
MTTSMIRMVRQEPRFTVIVKSDEPVSTIDTGQSQIKETCARHHTAKFVKYPIDLGSSELQYSSRMNGQSVILINETSQVIVVYCYPPVPDVVPTLTIRIHDLTTPLFQVGSQQLGNFYLGPPLEQGCCDARAQAGLNCCLRFCLAQASLIGGQRHCRPHLFR